MQEIFLKAIEKLTDPIAIIAIVLMFLVVLLSITISRSLPKINMTLGKLTTLIERMVYDDSKDN